MTKCILFPDAATFTVSKDDKRCEVSLTCAIEVPLMNIESKGGTVAILFHSTIKWEYSTSSGLTDGSENTATSVDFVASVNALTVTIPGFDATYEGLWSCQVMNSLIYDAVSNIEDVLVTSAACHSKYF